jgi:hypothetical protein
VPIARSQKALALGARAGREQGSGPQSPDTPGKIAAVDRIPVVDKNAGDLGSIGGGFHATLGGPDRAGMQKSDRQRLGGPVRRGQLQPPISDAAQEVPLAS